MTGAISKRYQPICCYHLLALVKNYVQKIYNHTLYKGIFGSTGDFCTNKHYNFDISPACIQFTISDFHTKLLLDIIATGFIPPFTISIIPLTPIQYFCSDNAKNYLLVHLICRRMIRLHLNMLNILCFFTLSYQCLFYVFRFNPLKSCIFYFRPVPRL